MAIARIPAFTQKTDEFTSSGTWVCPSSVYSAEFLVVGAGGAGGGVGASGATRYAAGGGGGGGAVKKQILKLTPGATYTITIGAGGTGSAATSGATGGFSEVLLSGTTLIRSLGGGGGSGVNASDSEVYAAVANLCGGGGRAAFGTADSLTSGGGGGASLGLNGITITYFDIDQSVGSAKGNEGTNGKSRTQSLSDQYGFSLGMPGIDGFGQGGNGSSIKSSSDATATFAYGAGNGIIRTTTGSQVGNAATIAGCGGGGAVTFTNTTSRAGGNGFNGLVRITYVG